MLNETLSFLKTALNNHLRLMGTSHEPQEDQVVFLSGNNSDARSFKAGAVTEMLVRLEEEKVLRADDLYQRRMADGSTQRAAPAIRLNLYVLFVAHYPQYEDAMKNLSAIIRYFQNHRLITHQSAPELDPGIEHLVMELLTLTFAEQNEVWGSLRAPYHPSVLYRVKMVVYDADAKDEVPNVSEAVLGLQGRGVPDYGGQG